MKKLVSDYWSLFAVAGIVVLLDQITKYYVRANLAYGDIWSPWPWLAPYARIVHWRNTGAAFGMFQSMGGVFRILAIIVSLAILYYYPKVSREDWPLRLAMGLQMGGALGNLIDRLTIGSVTDFISVGNFAVFNIADACISLGVGILILGMWIKERQEAKDGQHAAEAQDDLSDRKSELAAPTEQEAPIEQPDEPQALDMGRGPKDPLIPPFPKEINNE